MIRSSLSLGGSDRASIKFLKKWPRGFYVSPLVDNFDCNLQDFLIKQCFENGAAMFARRSAHEMQMVREWARGHLDASQDNEVYQIVQYFFERVKNYTHIRSLSDAEIPFARTTGECHPVRLVKVQETRLLIRAFRQMSLQQYGDEVYGKDHGFPPFDLDCRCRMEGVIPGV
jgi:hypothetical protein